MSKLEKINLRVKKYQVTTPYYNNRKTYSKVYYNNKKINSEQNFDNRRNNDNRTYQNKTKPISILKRPVKENLSNELISENTKCHSKSLNETRNIVEIRAETVSRGDTPVMQTIDYDITDCPEQSFILPVICVKIGNTRVSCLIDTGSQITAISKQLLDRIKKENVNLENKIPILPTKNLKVRTAISQKTFPVRQAVCLPCTIDKQNIIEINAYIMPDLTSECILGVDWMDRQQYNIF